MSKITIAIPFTTDNASMAERLCDWIYHLSGQQAHAVLVCDQMVHEELKAKVKIAAEVAFSTVDMVTANTTSIPKQVSGHFWMNLMFLAGSEFIARNCRWPFLWLEPECVPTKRDWVEMISGVYESQSKRYLGTHMMAGGVRFLSRIAVYPVSAFNDFSGVEDKDGPYEMARSNSIIAKSSRTKLFQHQKIEDESDCQKIRDESCLLVGDYSGIAMEYLRPKLKPSGRKSVPVRKSQNE